MLIRLTPDMTVQLPSGHQVQVSVLEAVLSDLLSGRACLVSVSDEPDSCWVVARKGTENSGQPTERPIMAKDWEITAS